MKLRSARIHNVRSISDVFIEVSDYTLLVGANNAGKSNLLNALRLFYEDIKWSSGDVPKFSTADNESWIELKFELTDIEWDSLADQYKKGATSNSLSVRRYFRSSDKERVKSNQSNIYGYVNDEIEKNLFYGAKNVGSAKLGQIVYIPALTTADEQTKLSGPSPLREVLNFLLKKIVGSSPSYMELEKSFQKLNDEARGNDGFLSEIARPLNDAISEWNIKIDLSVNSMKPEDISKNLVSFTFQDVSLGDASFDLARYGHGFQRSVIYELIRLAPTFRDVKISDKKEFSPDLTIILFEEPEAFLHPSQQENMTYHLRRLARGETQQVLICTHSSTFVGKAAEEIGQIIRFRREGGVTNTYQPNSEAVNKLFQIGGDFIAALQAFVNDPAVPDADKNGATRMISNPPSELIAEAQERFRFQLWLDGERSALFFADRVLLVEGASERALFNYLLSDAWHELSRHRICVVDVLGKYNFHRYMGLMKAFQIPFGVILDDDEDKKHQKAVNELVRKTARMDGMPILAAPEEIPNNLEVFLGLPKVDKERNDKKPLEIMKAITTEGRIEAERLGALREVFCRALNLPVAI